MDLKLVTGLHDYRRGVYYRLPGEWRRLDFLTRSEGSSRVLIMVIAVEHAGIVDSLRSGFRTMKDPAARFISLRPS